MKKIKIAIHGLGNIGVNVIKSIQASPDLKCIGVIRRKQSLGSKQDLLNNVPDFCKIDDLINAQGQPDVIILCSPSKIIPQDALFYLEAGFNTVDSFDIHSDLTKLINDLEAVAKKNNCISISGAGWDPGTDSVFRALFEIMAPIGTTFTNFGRGRSMGHSVAARNIAGVKEAVSITIPMGCGLHSRLVYVLAKDGADFTKIETDMQNDPYFSFDPLTIKQVQSQEELNLVADNSHGVLIERLGGSALISNQRFKFEMKIDNPALTAQIMTASARATAKLKSGSYTLIDIPPIYLLPGDRLEQIARLV